MKFTNMLTPYREKR